MYAETHLFRMNDVFFLTEYRYITHSNKRNINLKYEDILLQSYTSQIHYKFILKEEINDVEVQLILNFKKQIIIEIVNQNLYWQTVLYKRN